MFGQKNPKQTPVMSPRMKLELQYKTCRGNLLAVIIFTLISMVTVYFFGTYFLFSANVPIFIFMQGVFSAQIADGTYAYMNELTADDIEYYAEYGDMEFMIAIVIALVILLAYFICWLVSKKHPAAMIVATVFFAIDCIVLLLSFDISMILDIIFHIWVMYYLIAAIVASAKLKKLPPEEAAPIEGAYTIINGEKVPSASAVPSEFSDPTESNDNNTPNE